MKRIVMASLVLFVMMFGLTCLIPWFDSKSGEKLPLGSIYVNDIEGWAWVRLMHSSICFFGALLAAVFIRRLTRRM
jgi:hypothetical protein